ncbi:hypothetical protein F4823DRAFT_243793 [Ustulina deusta]|nr:hypothetical protein F4823DRAFT_243793 [Ustulina deusta]
MVARLLGHSFPVFSAIQSILMPSLPGILSVQLREGVGFLSKFQGQDIGAGDCAHGYQASDQNSFKPYAVLQYGKSQVIVASLKGTPDNPRWRTGPNAVCRFDVSWAAELIIYINLDVSNYCPRGQDVFIGLARLSPLNGAAVSGPQWLELECGSGKICIDLSYAHLEKTVCELDTRGFRRLSISGRVLQFTKKDTKRQYAQKTIRSTQDILLFTEPRRIRHPFITPLAYGADPNVGYHDLQWHHTLWYDQQQIMFS